MRRVFFNALVGLLVIVPVGRAADSAPLPLDLQKPRAEIRAALLRMTPLGSSAAEVLKFIGQHLPPDVHTVPALVNKPAPVPGEKVGAKYLRLFLGQYYENLGVIFLTAPMVTERAVNAVWIFDSDDKLIELVVEKKSDVY